MIEGGFEARVVAIDLAHVPRNLPVRASTIVPLRPARGTDPARKRASSTPPSLPARCWRTAARRLVGSIEERDGYAYADLSLPVDRGLASAAASLAASALMRSMSPMRPGGPRGPPSKQGSTW